MSLIRLVPWIVHTAVEYAAGLLFLLAPFILGFADDTAAVTFFVLLGVGHAALSLLTSFPVGTSEPA